MQLPRGSARRRTNRAGRLVVILAICLVLGYGFYVQTRDFHTEVGFQRHRKELQEVGSVTVSRVQGIAQDKQAEAEALSISMDPGGMAVAAMAASPRIGSGLLNDLPAKVAEVGQQIAHSLPRTSDAIRLASKNGQLHISEETREEALLQSLVGEQELRVQHHTKDDGFRSLPPLGAGDGGLQQDTDLRGSQKGQAGGALESGTTEEGWRERQEAVRAATQESWAVYEQYAMGADELRPLTLKGKTTFGDMGATLVDSLDTLWMMGLRSEFDRARQWVSEKLNFDKPAKLSLFETTIRIVGGLLSAYDLSEDRMFLGKAQQLVELLMPAFATATTGIPNNVVYINQGEEKKFRSSQTGRAALAEFGSLQVEFVALSQRTANSTYGEKAEAIMQQIFRNYPDKGLQPVWFNRRLGKTAGSNLYTVGAMADSYFEYLLKMWLLHQKQEEVYRSMWEKATDEALERLVAISPGGLTFLGQRKHNGNLVGKMEHLACYFPGSMALGVAQGAVSGAKAQHYLDVAANLTYTCWQMYERTLTGLGMDMALFDGNGELQPKGKANMLRPETVEALFYLWRVTGEPKYREWGWRIFEAFRTHSRTPEGAYASVEDVNQVPVKQEDGMESFWLAETLKYLWLLFGPDELLSLDTWVLNTEAHPLRISLPGQ